VDFLFSGNLWGQGSAVTLVNDDSDGDVCGILGCPVGAHPIEYAIYLSNCPQNLYALWEEY
jgi:hypothetical protein